MRKARPTVAFPGSGDNERPLSQALQAARAAQATANASPLAASSQASGVVFTAGQTVRVPHGLGRAPEGWLVAYATGSAPALYASVSDASYITLTHSGASTTRVTLLFF